MGTAGARNPGRAMILYLSTKGAIDTITQVLAKELGPKNIRVNADVATGIWNWLGILEHAATMVVPGARFAPRVPQSLAYPSPPDG